MGNNIHEKKLLHFRMTEPFYPAKVKEHKALQLFNGVPLSKDNSSSDSDSDSEKKKKGGKKDDKKGKGKVEEDSLSDSGSDSEKKKSK
ncbi:hypothetical protein F53441_11659 [Fusarium austroafricanum]|uniref:Uncharacterized protein n=1 Tax=Fusarium austroafricanum TaxID=2364996 RepID=A0A8H4K4P7_9HYPO|nr:hypothetical protein F53441_11659 [Fusarium austroafricanum]